jgi:hypothetical protein
MRSRRAGTSIRQRLNSERQAVRKIDRRMNRKPSRVKSWWSGGLARIGTIAAGLVLALVLVGCDPNDRSYFREGIGTQLYTVDTASATELQNIYLDYLCRQSNSFVGPDVPSCAQQMIPANVWPIMVQAGMNDIDARCDAYLAWLDVKRREKDAVLAEIGSIRFAVDALTNPNIAGVSAVGLAAISAAFGLATNTVNNLNMLLLQVDHTTVQNVVIPNRHIFREDLLKVSAAIDNKPAAVHTLRTYLSICMPMTIAANINSTVTVFQQTGGMGGGNVMPPTLGAAFTARQPVQKPARPIISDEQFKKVIAEFDPNVHSTGFVQNILKRLCAPPAEVANVTSRTNARIMAYQQNLQDTGDPTARPTGKLTPRELGLVGQKPICQIDKFQNLYEAENFPRGIADVGLIALMNKKLAADRQLANDANAATIRTRIAEIRRALDAQLKLRGDALAKDLSDQLTSDLVNLLAK